MPRSGYTTDDARLDEAHPRGVTATYGMQRVQGEVRRAEANHRVLLSEFQRRLRTHDDGIARARVGARAATPPW